MKLYVSIILMLVSTGALAQPDTRILSLETAIGLAIDSDPWLKSSQLREVALNEKSVSQATLPDPKLSLAAANFPTDTFDINQEAMTQVTVGISQMFPRGDSQELTGRQQRELALQEPMLRQDRKAKVTATVTQLWLEAYRAQESIRRIERDRSLFEHLVDATSAGYSSALGRARQQDVIRAQLELTRIDDRLTVLRQQFESAQRRLSEWVGVQARQPLPEQLPSSERPELMDKLISHSGDAQWFYQQISQHPLLLAFDHRINAMQANVELARQKYKPEWGLSAQYGYRDDDPMGRDRADLFSVGVTFDLPFFTGNRQDKEVNASLSQTESLKSDKLLLVRQLIAELETAVATVQRLNERRTLYQQQLLPQMANQAEAALSAYNSDDGDFAEAVRARIAELNAKIEALTIAVKREQELAKIRYLTSHGSPQ